VTHFGGGDGSEAKRPCLVASLAVYRLKLSDPPQAISVSGMLPRTTMPVTNPGLAHLYGLTRFDRAG
jgi:hypothetical protein